ASHNLSRSWPLAIFPILRPCVPDPSGELRRCKTAEECASINTLKFQLNGPFTNKSSLSRPEESLLPETQLRTQGHNGACFPVALSLLEQRRSLGTENSGRNLSGGKPKSCDLLPSLVFTVIVPSNVH
ncbi:hypothetical protein KUCAC02_010863, partial [Chaenocephalus aceratus]